ncbi:beta-galactosidase GalB [Wenyingzhuangia aestuarii]|uniref:beta-galactosidase GalB n=1 Tax=Wenyingzhuangia aestuarii TaxID=1647582 RepID=UPI00143CA1A5|nr:beta-galactosidase GalB [Wenyingzhuangia aestuarii]NJB83549.1 beta-galactosidase [Wenyingzhuangia aestuarii]
MKISKYILGVICMLSISIFAQRETSSFNENWKFARFGAMPDGSTKTEPKDIDEVTYDDSNWRTLNLPHDWGIEGPFRADLPNQTGKLPWAGIGWYRKVFTATKSDLSKKVFVEFDGSMSNTSVFVNGGYVGEWAYGYSSFRFEISRYLKQGNNTIAVRLNNKEASSRWYPGGGIYRNVHLVKTNPTHIAHWGTFVTTPNVSTKEATIEITTEVVGVKKDVEVMHEIYTAGNNAVKVAEQKIPYYQPSSITISNPKLWDLENPNLYTLKTTLTKKGKVLDVYKTTFGIRSIEYNANGFFLNGKKVRMNGVCQHHDLGPLGTAVNVRAMERQIEILKSFGVNAIRTAHNPPAPEFLELCDKMGVLVQVEAFDVWGKKKVDNDYASLFGAWHKKDLITMVKRDRNHPSVVMWSTGNELIELREANDAPLAAKLADIIRSVDTTRPTTFGNSRPEAASNGFEKTADVFGFNYKPHMYQDFIKANPNTPLYGSETASTISSRGEYFFPVNFDDKKQGNGGFFQVSSYDYSAPNWADIPEKDFEAEDKFPGLFGQFVWTGFDYIGEPTPYNKDKTNLLNFSDPKEKARMKAELAKMGNQIPPRSSYFGIVDLCGFPKDRYYLYQSKWKPELPMAHILPHWNWPERVGKVTPVLVYTSGDEAELFLNGKSLGRKKKGQYEYRLIWKDVVYQKGELKVVAYKNGKKWATEKVKTTGIANKVSLAADRTKIKADGQDLSFITVEIKDRKGQTVPRTHNIVSYTISGPGEIVAVGNGDATSHESFQATTRKVFNGMALVVVKSKKGETGKITVTATSKGLKTTKINLITE